MSHRPPARVLILGLALLALAGAACGSDDSDDEGSPTSSTPSSSPPGEPTVPGADDEASFPLQVLGDNGELTIEARPGQIVSLSPTATEMIFAVGAGDAVVAVDELSNFPAEAPVTDLSGFTPNLEAIASYDPDLVVVSTDIGGLIAGLEGIGVPVLQLDAAADLEDTYRQLEVLGAATGHVGDAAEVVAQMRADIDDVLSRLSGRGAGDATSVTFFHELDDQLFSVTSSTFIGEIYTLAGLTNIADAADTAGGGYPQLASEYVIAEDPDLIFLADTKCCGQSAATVAARPGWDQLTAVRTGAVYEIDDDIASRWGPRVVELLEIVVEATATVAAG